MSIKRTFRTLVQFLNHTQKGRLLRNGVGVFILFMFIVQFFSSSNDGSQRVNRSSNVTCVKREKEETKYLVFDAQKKIIDLELLSGSPPDWVVYLVNGVNVEKSLVKCPACQVVDADWITKNVQENIPFYTKYGAQIIDKMGTYLYLLREKNAEWIYTSNNEQALPWDTLERMAVYNDRLGLVYTGSRPVLEPCSHFMDPFTWHGQNVASAEQARYNVRRVSPDAIIQPVGSCLKQGQGSGSTWTTSFDMNAPSSYAGPGQFTAVDFHNILVTKSSAWVLVVSLMKDVLTSTSDYKTSLKFNLMVQRFLWHTNIEIGFSATIAASDDCPTCAIHDVMTDQLGELMQHDLRKWTCSKTDDCLSDLAAASFREPPSDRLDINEVLRVWISLLPMSSRPSYNLSNARSSTDSKDPIMFYTPAKSMLDKKNQSLGVPHSFGEICGSQENLYRAVVPKNHRIDDILLIITLNYPMSVSNIPLLEYTYGRHFKYIAYCGERAADFVETYQTSTKIKKNPVTFIQVAHNFGNYAHDCVNYISKLDFKVSGYLHITDDVVLNSWNLPRLPRNKPWFQHMRKRASIHDVSVMDICETCEGNKWRAWEEYRDQTRSVFAQLDSFKEEGGNCGDEAVRMLRTLKDNTGCKDCFVYESSNVFFIPKAIIESWSFCINIMSENSVKSEIAVPTCMYGSSPATSIFKLSGTYLKDQERSLYKDAFSELHVFMHPFDLDLLAKTDDSTFYCDNILKRMDADLSVSINKTSVAQAVEVKALIAKPEKVARPANIRNGIDPKLNIFPKDRSEAKSRARLARVLGGMRR